MDVPPVQYRPPADAPAVVSGKVDAETGAYNYEAPYSIPDDPVEDPYGDEEQE